jgi:hypothetical protein
MRSANVLARSYQKNAGAGAACNRRSPLNIIEPFAPVKSSLDAERSATIAGFVMATRIVMAKASACSKAHNRH